MLRRALALGLLALPAPALAQLVHGDIKDVSGAPVAAVTITVLDMAGRPIYAFTTGSEGEFRLPVRSRQPVLVRFERLGFVGVTSKALTVGPSEQLELEVRLAVSPVELPPVTAVAKRYTEPRLVEFYQRAALAKRTSWGRVWTREDLEKHPITMVSHLLRTVHTRPFGGCTRNEVFIDGLPLSVDMRNPDVDDDVVDWMVTPDDVEGIEIYNEPQIPPQFNPANEYCRVTLIWRKAYSEHGPTLAGRSSMTFLGIVGASVLFGRLLWLIH